MTKRENEHYKEMRTVGYWSAWGGVELKEIQYGIEDYAIVVANSFLGGSVSKAHRVRIHYEDRSYIKLEGHTYYFDECIRNGI